MTKEERRLAAFRRRLLIVVGCLGGAALFFFLGFLVAGRPALRSFESSRPPVYRPDFVVRQSWSREDLVKVLNRLEKKLATSQPAKVIDRHWEVMHNGAHEWIRVRLQGEYQDLENLAQVLDAYRALLLRDFNLRILIHLDRSSGTLKLLILDGEEVVVVGSFIPASEELIAGPEFVRPQLAIVIDDLGHNLESAAKFTALPLPLTFAVFPMLENSLKVAAYFADYNRDIILHAPMEPRGYPSVNPGPGALLSSMGDEELSAVFVEDLQFLPGIIGVNNHMGSRLTADPQKMAQVMKILRGRNLFFLDSRTIADSVAYKRAVEAGIPALQRDVFLDNVQDVEYIVEQFKALIEVARVKGSAIGIGHPYPETITALGFLPEMASQAGVEVVALREFVSLQPEQVEQ